MPQYDLGRAVGEIRIDARQALKEYGKTRAAHASTITKMEESARATQKVGLALTGVGVAAVAAFGMAVKATADFDKQLSFFQAITNASGKQMDLVKQKAFDLGRTAGISASDVAAAFTELGKAGVGVKDLVNGVADATIQLAQAADISASSAATTIVNVQQTFGLAAKDAVHIADTLAGAANASTVDIEDLAYSMKYAGSTAHALRIPMESLADALAILGNNGIRGSTAGTSLRKVLISLNPSSDKAAAMMKKLGIITKDGANQFFDASGRAKDFAGISQVLQNSMKGLSQAERVHALNVIFGNRAISSALILAEGGAKAFHKMHREVGKVTALQVMNKRLDNLSGAWKRFTASLNTAMIQAGAPAQEPLKKLLQLLTRLVNWFSRLSPTMQKTIVWFILISTVLVGLAGTFVLAISMAFRFYVALRRFRTAMRLVREMQLMNSALRIMRGLFGSLTAVMMANPWVLIAAAVIALGVAFYFLYKHSKTFRDFMNKIGHGLVVAWRAVVKFFSKTVPAAFKKAWGAIKRAFSTGVGWVRKNWDILLAILLPFPGMLILIWHRFGGRIIGFVKKTVSGIINWFKALPGNLRTLSHQAVTGVTHFFSNLPYEIGYALGFALGRMIKWGKDSIIWALTTAHTIYDGLVNWFEKLPGRVEHFFSQMAKDIWKWMKQAWHWAVTEATALFWGVVHWFQALPGRVAHAASSVWHAVVNWFTRTKNAASSSAHSLFSSVVHWFSMLPGRVWHFISAMASRVQHGMVAAWQAALRGGKSIYRGIVGWIEGLPGVVRRIIGRVIQAFKNMISDAFKAASGFARGLWDGFKHGLGINSPSFIEKAMFQMEDNVAASIKKLHKHVRTIQRLGATLPVIDTQSALATTPRSMLGGRKPASPNALEGDSAHPTTLVKVDVHNPVRESAADSTAKRLSRLAALGVI